MTTHPGIERIRWVLLLLLALILLAQPVISPLVTGEAAPASGAVPPPALHLPIILVPGLGASWNWEVLLDADIPFIDLGWDWALPGWPVARTHWARLITALEAAGYTQDEDYFVAFYDWRKDNNWQTPGSGKIPRRYLMETIDEARQKWEARNPNLPPADFKVNLMAHSLGGLVVRSYVESPYYRGDVNQVIILGAPHQGAADAYYAWEGGQVPPRGDVVTRFVWSLYLQLLQLRHGDDTYTLIHERGKVAHNLLPVDFDYLIRRDGTAIPWQSMVEVNPFLADAMPREQAASVFAQHGVGLAVVVGAGITTTERLQVNTDTDAYYPRWQDGKPERILYGDGDGTVPAISALIPGVPPIILPGTDHGGLMNAALEQILALLGVESPGEVAQRTTETASPGNILSIFATGADVQPKDAAGHPVGQPILLPPIVAPLFQPFHVIVVPDLAPGQYTLTTTGAGMGSARVTIQLLEQDWTTTEEIDAPAGTGTSQTYRLTYRPGAARRLHLGPDRIYLPLVMNVHSEKVTSNQLSVREVTRKGDRHFLNPVGRAAMLVLRPKQVLQTQFRSAGHLISLSPRKSCQ